MKIQKPSPAKSRDRLKRGAAAPSPRQPRESSLHPGTTAGADLPPTSKLSVAVFCLAIGLATLAVYAQTYGHGFVAYDDPQYVYDNATVKAGLKASGVVWAFTTFYYANWHPVTWLSLMLDCQLFGLNAGANHLVNAAFHMASALLLFLVLVRMTRKPWRSALVAGIFAFHPLHVESVAWISERKDVLSAFFGILTLLLYVRYTEARSARRYIPMALAFALGLMSKPMLVTLPFVLLLLDFWPLRRLEWPPAWSAEKQLLWEKSPLIVMAAFSSVLTFLAQRQSKTVSSLLHLPFSTRLANAAVAYMSYIGKAFWPENLAAYYPYEALQVESVLGGLLILVAVSVTSLLLARKYPYLLVGWLWYLGMLVPVIGIVQVGEQAMADRYAYLPLIGLSLALVWGATDFLDSRRFPRIVTAILAGVALLLFAIVAWRQTGYWKNSRTLFEHTLAVTKGNYLFQNNLGVIYTIEGKRDEAISLFRDAVAINPGYAEAHANLGRELLRAGKPDESYPHLAEALRLKPDLPVAHAAMGTLLALRKEFEQSRVHLSEVLRSFPDDSEIRSNLCAVLQQLGRLDEAVTQCTEALRLKPDFVDAQFNLGGTLAAQGKNAEAVAALSRVLAADPNHAGARDLLNRLQGPAK